MFFSSNSESRATPEEYAKAKDNFANNKLTQADKEALNHPPKVNPTTARPGYVAVPMAQLKKEREAEEQNQAARVTEFYRDPKATKKP